MAKEEKADESLHVNAHQLLSLNIRNTALYQISTETHFHINVTFSYLNYKGFNDPICTFSGLTAYDIFNQVHSDIFTECVPSRGIYKHQPIYSQHNNVFLVIYVYPEYGNINMRLLISATPCYPITINTCAFAYLCRSSTISPFCEQFSKGLNQLPVVNTNYKKNGYFKYYFDQSSVLMFAIPDKKCYVMQMTHYLDYKPIGKSLLRKLDSIKQCKIEQLKHSRFVSSKRLVQYYITGFLKGLLIKWCFYLLKDRILKIQV